MTFDPTSVEVTCVTLPKDHIYTSPMKICQSMWIQWPFFFKNLNQSSLTPRWPLTPSLLGIHQCMWIQWLILLNTTYYILTTHYIQNEWSHSLFLKFRRDNNKDSLGDLKWRMVFVSIGWCGVKKKTEIDTEIKTPIISSISLFAAILFGIFFVQVCLLSFCREIVLKCIAKTTTEQYEREGQCYILLFSASVATYCRDFSRLKNKKGTVFLATTVNSKLTLKAVFHNFPVPTF